MGIFRESRIVVAATIPHWSFDVGLDGCRQMNRHPCHHHSSPGTGHRQSNFGPFLDQSFLSTMERAKHNMVFPIDFLMDSDFKFLYINSYYYR